VERDLLGWATGTHRAHDVIAAETADHELVAVDDLTKSVLTKDIVWAVGWNDAASGSAFTRLHGA